MGVDRNSRIGKAAVCKAAVCKAAVCMALAAGLVMSGVAEAGEAGDCSTGGVAQQLSCMNAEGLVLQRELAIAQIRAAMEKLSAVKKTRRKLPVPVVVTTYGVDGHSQAMLLWTKKGKSLGTLHVTPGQGIPGGWTVKSIHNGLVIIARGGERKVLILGAEGMTESPPHGTQAQFLGGTPMLHGMVSAAPMSPAP